MQHKHTRTHTTLQKKLLHISFEASLVSCKNLITTQNILHTSRSLLQVKKTAIMGRQSKDPAIVGSSIVLLQERFKQLQRLKEMREQRRLLKLWPQSSDGYDESSNKSEAAFQDPLALGLTSSAHHMAHFRAIEPQQFPSAAKGPHNFFEKTDVVDTSLRL